MGNQQYYTYNFFGHVPTDRLITGFLSVNVVHNNSLSIYTDDWKADNGAYDRNIPTNRDEHQAPPSKCEGQYIGDYHTFIYYLAVACHWHPARIPTYTAPGTSDRELPDHPHCQSFIRAYPLGLINPDTGTLLNHKVITVDGQDGVVVSKLGNPKNGGTPDSDSFASNWYWETIASQFGVHNGLGSPYKQPTGTMIDEGLVNQFDAPDYSGGGGNPYSGFPDMAWNRDYRIHTGNNTGLMPNYGNGYVDSNGGVDDPPISGSAENGDGVAEDVTTDIDNTLKSPVKSVLVEGWHDFAYTDNGVDAFTVTRHSPYSLRVQVKLVTDQTDNDGVDGPGAPNDEEIAARGTRCNVMFNPFGETNGISFTQSPPAAVSTDGS